MEATIQFPRKRRRGGQEREGKKERGEEGGAGESGHIGVKEEKNWVLALLSSESETLPLLEKPLKDSINADSHVTYAHILRKKQDQITTLHKPCQIFRFLLYYISYFANKILKLFQVLFKQFLCKQREDGFF